MSRVWLFIWQTAEFLGIDLGMFAPFVFGKMMGQKGKRIK